MESLRYGKNIYVYMANFVNEKKARNHDSVSVARCYCFLLRETVFLKKLGEPFCRYFRCRLKNLLRDVLVKRDTFSAP